MNRTLIGAAAIAAGVGIGSVAGALVGAPTTTGAAESADPTVAAAVAFEFEDGGPGRGRHLLHAGLETAAATIGITEDELVDALRDGQTIAEVATANGVEVETVVGALTAEAHARVDEALAEGRIDEAEAEELRAGIDERVTAVVNGELPFGGPGRPGGIGWRGHGLETAAETIGIEVDELRTALRDGQTVAEVAEANGVAPQDVIDALVAEATERITAFVTGD